MNLNQKGVVQYFLIFVLLLGLGVGLYLVQQRTNLLPKAYEAPPQVASECTYVPEALYRVHVKAASDQVINIKSNCTNLNSPVTGVGSLLYVPTWLPKTGEGDQTAYLVQDLENICKTTSYSGPLCKLCRQTVDCKNHLVTMVVKKVENLVCKGQSIEQSSYDFTGSASIRIYPHLFAGPSYSCYLDMEEKDIKVDVNATYIEEYTPDMYLEPSPDDEKNDGRG